VVEDPEYPPLRVQQSYIDRLEGWCDEFNEGLPKLDSFILPGGTRWPRSCTSPGR
jgi:cob(I)alamin adenosyltransferase